MKFQRFLSEAETKMDQTNDPDATFFTLSYWLFLARQQNINLPQDYINVLEASVSARLIKLITTMIDTIDTSVPVSRNSFFINANGFARFESRLGKEDTKKLLEKLQKKVFEITKAAILNRRTRLFSFRTIRDLNFLAANQLISFSQKSELEKI